MRRIGSRAMVVAGVMATLGVLPAGALAADLTAQCTDTAAPDYLQTRLDNSNDGDVITLVEGSVCDPGVLASDEFRLRTDRQITLQGNGTGAPEVFDGDSEYRTLRGSDVGATVIRNLTFRDADYGGSGAAIKIQGDSAPTISNVEILDSNSDERAPVTIDASGAGGTVTVEDSHFGVREAGDGNGNSGETGGGLHIDTAHAIVLARNVFRGNRASDDGGGAVLRLDPPESGDAAPVTITDNKFVENVVEHNGQDEGDGTLAGGGLAIFAPPGDRLVTQARNLFDSNRVIPRIFFLDGADRGFFFAGQFFGGGEYTEVSVVSTDDQYIANSISAPPLEKSLRGEGPQGEISGGGIAVSGLDLDFTARNLVLAANKIDSGEGAGIASRRGFSNVLTRTEVNANVLRLLDSTVVANDAGEGTGAAIAGWFDDQLRVHNGIVYGNTAEEGDEIDGFGEGLKEILYSDACEGDGTTPHEGEGNICKDPALVDPAAGKVDQTGASPTIEAGSNSRVPDDLFKDYKGNGRILDSGTDGARVDMGAHEFPGPEPKTSTTSQQPSQTAGPKARVRVTVAGISGSSCARTNFTLRVRSSSAARIRRVRVFLDGRRLVSTSRSRFRVTVPARRLKSGRHRITVIATDRAGTSRRSTRRFRRCARAAQVAPRLTG